MRCGVTTAVLLTAVVGACVLTTGTARAQEATTATAPAFDAKIDGDYGPHLPPAVYKPGSYGEKVDKLINMLHVFMIALFVAWGLFMIMCLVKFRQRAGHTANSQPIKAKMSKYAEVGVAIFEVFLLVGLSIPAWGSVKNEMPTDEENPVHLRVVAEQFQWNFHYPGPDGIFGKTAMAYIDAAENILGIDPDDPNGADDLFSPELHFPVDRKVICEVTSKDVIHSFALPVLRVKQDVIPGMRIPVWFEAGKTGNYEVACAQLCGNNHYSMRALMHIHATDDEFAAWVESQRPAEFDEDDLD